MPLARTKPKKHLSQNFLVDRQIAERIVRSAHLSGAETVVEVGSGEGALTDLLQSSAAMLYGIEIDARLAAFLKERFETENCVIVNEDFLKLDPDRLLQDVEHEVIVIGNLPYHITSPIIFKCLEQTDKIQKLIIMVQKEVATRICSGPDSKDYGILSVFCQFYAECRTLFFIEPESFRPQPAVDSAVVEMRIRPFAKKPQDFEFFRTVVRTAFNQRRKMLRNSLAQIINGREIEFEWQRRPETLSIDEFIKLANLLHEE